MRQRIATILLIAFFLISSQYYPHPESTFQFRVLNRKHISHFSMGIRNNLPVIVILASHPSPWNFKSGSHALYFYCENCLREMKKLDKFLTDGYNIGLKLNGSQISEIKYFEP